MNKYLMESRLDLHLGTDQEQYDYISGENFILWADPQDKFKTRTNFKQLVVRHSPTGLSWGYGGSGVSDCSLNILLNYFSNGTGYVSSDQEAFINSNYMSFKDEYLFNMPELGGIITINGIKAFLNEKNMIDRNV